MGNLKLTLAYEGSDYNGWQIQEGQPHVKTIQGTLEQALERLLGHRVKTYASGRTDAGVHATGQVVSFVSDSSIPVNRLPIALNGILPADMVAIECRPVTEDFHARYSAKKKRYQYTILADPIPWPFYRHRAHHISSKLDLDAMIKAANEFQGCHDFSAFCSSKTNTASFVREVYACKVWAKDKFIYVDVEANGFLYNMVRIIVGTLLEVGSGRTSAGEIKQIIKSRKRSLAGPTAPAKGLCLEKVYY